MSSLSAYFTKPEWIEKLCFQLEDPELQVFHSDSLVLCLSQKHLHPYFVTDIWREVEILTVGTIAQAVSCLKQRSIFGYHLPFFATGRGRLIQEALRKMPHFEALPFPFPDLKFLGGFTLLDPTTLVCARKVWKPIPGGYFQFVENRVDPPSRAYLKLWEALLWSGALPASGDRCVDFGASPGGWTWVLSTLGAEVLAIDKAPLDDRLLRHPGVSVKQVSAFSIPPGSLGEIDWFVSDIACYPERFLPWIQAWIDSATVKRMICTIKLQGDDTPWEILHAIAAIPNACLTHLHYNKHELTFFWGSHKISQSIK